MVDHSLSQMTGEDMCDFPPSACRIVIIAHTHFVEAQFFVQSPRGEVGRPHFEEHHLCAEGAGLIDQFHHQNTTISPFSSSTRQRYPTRMQSRNIPSVHGNSYDKDSMALTASTSLSSMRRRRSGECGSGPAFTPAGLGRLMARSPRTSDGPAANRPTPCVSPAANAGDTPDDR